MSQSFTDLPEDPQELRAVAALMADTVKNQALLIEKLNHQLKGMQKHRFGSKSETAEQLGLKLFEQEADEALMDEAAKESPSKEVSQKPKREALPKNLPHHSQRVEPEETETCGDCGGKLRTLSEDTSEVLEYVPGHFIVKELVRPRLVCRDCEAITQAPLPYRAIDKGRYGPGLIAHIATSKYCDHLPLYRQNEIMARDGIHIPRSTMAEMLVKLAKLCTPLQDHILKQIKQSQALFADDTTIRLQPGKGSKGKSCVTARLWAYARDDSGYGSDNPPAVAFQFTTDRKGEHPVSHLKDYKGWVHADGYSGFNCLWTDGERREQACLAHVRRKFSDLVSSQQSVVGAEAVERIAKLYAIEKRIKGLPPDQRVQVRQAEAKQILDDLEAWLEGQQARVSGKTPLAAAIRYALNRLPKIRPYLDNGFLEIDNNTVERCIRPIGLGRKNYLFVGSIAGGQAAALFYTLIGTAKLNDVCPRAYLTWLFETIAGHSVNDIEALTPWAFKRLQL